MLADCAWTFACSPALFLCSFLPFGFCVVSIVPVTVLVCGVLSVSEQALARLWADAFAICGKWWTAFVFVCWPCECLLAVSVSVCLCLWRAVSGSELRVSLCQSLSFVSSVPSS